MAVNVQKSRLRETCQLRFKFLLLIPVTLQYSSNICLFSPKTTLKHSSLVTSENVFSNERSDC